MIFLVSHLDISGNDIKESHSQSILLINLTLEIFYIDISGKDINDLHFINKPAFSITFSVFHFDISGKVINPLICPEGADLKDK